MTESGDRIDGRPPAANVADLLRHAAADDPDRPAVLTPPRSGPQPVPRADYRVLSYGELDARADSLARGLIAAGVRRGERVGLMVRPGEHFAVAAFGLFRAGAVAVLIDPGMGLRRVVRCLRETEPAALIAVPPVIFAERLPGVRVPSVRLRVCVGRPVPPWAVAWDALLATGGGDGPLPAVAATDPAAVIFTSGSTGPPKGVCYEHGMFVAQVRMLREAFGIEPGEVDVPTFPLFALFDVGLRSAMVVPRMNPTKPARVDPREVIGPIRELGASRAFGSPALWDRVGRHLESTGTKLPSVRRLLSSGAPVPPGAHRRLTAALADGVELHTPYGATECLPVATIGSGEVLGETAAKTRAGAGTCVGRPFNGVDVRVIASTNGPIASMDSAEELAAGRIGEIVASSDAVTREYFRRPHDTRLAKIPDGDRVWHRMGDVGYFDDAGRLWFCGRKTHVVHTADGPLYPVRCEAVVNADPRVYRTALVGVGERGGQTPVFVVEPEAGHHPRGGGVQPRRSADAKGFADELLARAAANPEAARVRHVLFHRSLPVDVRHNTKIDRPALARWAAKRL